MAKATFDKSRLLQLFARVGEEGVPKILTFINADGTDHAIASYDFELPVFLRAPNPSTIDPLFTLTIGDGLTVQNTNELLIEISLARSLQNPDTNFWKLIATSEDHTWLNGPFFFHNGEFDGVDETDTLTITENGTAVEITISGGGGSGTVTSVGLTVPSFLSVSGSPVTTAGTLAVTLATQAANLVFAGPTTGVAAAPTFRALVAGDIPDLTAVYQPLDSDLTAIAALTVNGALIKTSGVWSMAAHPAAAGRFLRSSSVSAIGWSTLTIPNTATTGDILIANTTNQLSTIGIGAEGDVLTVSSGIPAWASGIDSPTVLNVGATNATTVNLGTGSGNTNINIGTSGTNTIQIGNANSTVNILGTTIYENVTNLNVSDKLITINKGGAAGSAGGTGFEIEENNVVTGYIKTTGGRDGYLFLAPNNANDVSFLFTNISGARSYTLPNASGTLAISATSPIVLNATTGDISLTQTSITSLGTIGAGTWQGTVIAPAYGGTGVANNAASTITISGNFATTFITTSASSYTLPTANSTLLAASLGISGGTIFIGGTASGDDLTLQSTSDATRGFIYFGSAQTSGFDEVNSRIGIGVAAPTSRIDLAAGTTTVSSFHMAPGTNLSVAVAGTLEYNNSWFITNSTPTRLRIIGAGGLTSGRVSFATGSGTIDDSPNLTFVTNRLSGTTLYLTVSASTTSAGTAPIKMTSGTVMTTAEAGAFEYDGTDLLFTKSGTTRGTVLVGTAQTTEVVVSDATITTTMNGNTVKLLIKL